MCVMWGQRSVHQHDVRLRQDGLQWERSVLSSATHMLDKNSMMESTFDPARLLVHIVLVVLERCCVVASSCCRRLASVRHCRRLASVRHCTGRKHRVAVGYSFCQAYVVIQLVESLDAALSEHRVCAQKGDAYCSVFTSNQHCLLLPAS